MSGTALAPFQIVLSMLAWTVFLWSAGQRLWSQFRTCPGAHQTRGTTSCRTPTGSPDWWPLVAIAVGGLCFGLLTALSPGVPMTSTYSGLSHIDASLHIAYLDWNWDGNAEYPLAVPVFAAPWILATDPLVGFALATSCLTAVGAAGLVLALRNAGYSGTSSVASAIVVSTLPATLLFGGADSPASGYFGVLPWAILFVMDLARDSKSDNTSRGLGAAVFLAMASRPEAQIAPVALLSFAALAVGPGNARTLLARAAYPLTMALAAQSPYLLSLALADGTRFSSGTPGLFALAALSIPSVFLLGIAWLWTRSPASEKLRRWSAFGLLTVLAANLSIPELSLVPGEAAYQSSEILQTDFYASAGFFGWNTGLTPMAAILLCLWGALAPVSSRRVDRWHLAALALMVLLLLPSRIKTTGELPLEGIRNQIPALVPFGILVARGMDVLKDQLGRLNGFVLAMSLAGLAVASSVTCPLLEEVEEYDQRQEARFLQASLSFLPSGARLYIPDDTVPNSATGGKSDDINLFHLFNMEMAGLIFSGTNSLSVSGLSDLLSERYIGTNDYLYMGVDCARALGLGQHSVCERARRELDMDLMFPGVISPGTWSGDFLGAIHPATEPVIVGIYRLNGFKR